MRSIRQRKHLVWCASIKPGGETVVGSGTITDPEAPIKGCCGKGIGGRMIVLATTVAEGSCLILVL
jgi:hypothetical protein